MNEMPDSLLAADEPAPVTVHNENGPSPFLIIADHAGNSMPRALGRLSVPETECDRHIAWDARTVAAFIRFAMSRRECVDHFVVLARIMSMNRIAFPGRLDSHRRDVSSWPAPDLPQCPLSGHYQGISGT